MQEWGDAGYEASAAFIAIDVGEKCVLNTPIAITLGVAQSLLSKR